MRTSPLLRGALILGVAAVVLRLERTRRARGYVENILTHTARNLVVAGIAAVTVQTLEAPVVVPLARVVARRRWGLTAGIRSAWLRDLTAIVLLDYTLYLWHIVVHRMPWLWRFHLPHHVDLDLDASTGLRFHAGELAMSVPWRAAQVAAIGASPRALAAWQSLTLASVLFHHSNVRLSARTERVLSWLVATPGMHAIHHSVDPTRMQSNFSSGLAVWDRLHRTFLRDAEPEQIVVGVPGHLDREDASLTKILALPFSDRARPGPGDRQATR